MKTNDGNGQIVKDKQGFVTGKVERYSYGIYFFGQLIFYMLVTQFLQLFMTDSGIPAITVGIIFIVAKVWDAINDPLFGVIVDKCHLKKGKYIPWVRISGFLIPIATILLFAMPSGLSLPVKVIWCSIGYMLWDTSYTMCDVPIFALATSMTDNLKERNWLFLLNRFFMFVGGLVVIILVPMLYPAIGWTAAVVVLGIFGMITMVPVGYKAKERYFTDNEKSPTVKSLFSYLVKNKQLLIFSGALIVSSLTSTSGAVSSYVAIYCLGGVEWITYLGLIMTLPMIVSILLTQQLIKKVDKFTIYIVCMVVNLVFGVVLFFTGYTNIPLFVAITAVRSIFSSASVILIVMIVADCAEYGHYVTGERAQGMAFSVQTFTAKLTAALSGAIGMFMLGIVGFVEGTGAVQTASTIEWMWAMFTIVPTIGGVFAYIMLKIGYKLRAKDVELMMKVNAGELPREEADKALTIKYKKTI